MWPGVLSVSRSDFKPNATGVVYAHKDLVKRYISTLKDFDARKKAVESDEDDQDESSANATPATDPTGEANEEGKEEEESKE